MSSQQLLFIADTAFIDHSITQQYALLPVFPRESGDGAYRANLDELLHRSKLQSAYFDELLPKLLPVFMKYMPAAGDEIQHLIRPFLFAATSLFADRCIRVLHRIQQQQGKDIVLNQEDLRLAFNKDTNLEVKQLLQNFAQDFYSPLNLQALKKEML